METQNNITDVAIHSMAKVSIKRRIYGRYEKIHIKTGKTFSTK
jgi:hypothetical protein